MRWLVAFGLAFVGVFLINDFRLSMGVYLLLWANNCLREAK